MAKAGIAAGDNDDLKLYFDLMAGEGKVPGEKLLPVSQLYKSFLKDVGDERSPASILRKLARHLKKRGMEAWQIFNKEKARLAQTKHQLNEEFIGKILELKLLSV